MAAGLIDKAYVYLRLSTQGAGTVVVRKKGENINVRLEISDGSSQASPHFSPFQVDLTPRLLLISAKSSPGADPFSVTLFRSWSAAFGKEQNVEDAGWSNCYDEAAPTTSCSWSKSYHQTGQCILRSSVGQDMHSPCLLTSRRRTPA